MRNLSFLKKRRKFGNLPHCSAGRFGFVPSHVFSVQEVQKKEKENHMNKHL